MHRMCSSIALCAKQKKARPRLLQAVPLGQTNSNDHGDADFYGHRSRRYLLFRTMKFLPDGV